MTYEVTAFCRASQTTDWVKNIASIEEAKKICAEDFAAASVKRREYSIDGESLDGTWLESVDGETWK